MGLLTAICALSAPSTLVWAASRSVYSVVIRNGVIYDGSGGQPFLGDVAIDGDRIAYVGPHRALEGRTEIDARGQAVAPGFIDMMGHSEESLLIDGRAVSGLKQGVTLDIFTEQSKGPLNSAMARRMAAHEGDLKYEVSWHTLGEYLDHLQKRGIAPNVASFVGAGEARVNILGEGDVAPSPKQLDQMRALVHQAMEEGALGVTTALIYAPMNYQLTFQDHATFEKPLQYATGVADVLVNGQIALQDGEPTGGSSGRIVRGRAWSGAPGGGCRVSSKRWTWADQP